MPIFEEIIFSLSVALKKKRYLCSSRREKSSALKKAFFALSLVRSLENFKQEDRDNVTLILFVHVQRRAHYAYT